MTVKELKKRLSQYDENLPIYVYDQHFESMYKLGRVKQDGTKVILEFWVL